MLIPKVFVFGIEQKISSAFRRSITIDTGKVKVMGTKVVFTGTVCSFAERDDAEMAAWSVPGVTKVDNRIEIKVPEYAYEE